MRILMTGFTSRAIGSTKLLYEYMSNCQVIKKTLERAGHEVVQSTVDIDSEVEKEYDVALVGVAVPQSLSSRYVYGALWAAERFGPQRTRFFVDDWLLHQFKGQLESGIRNPEKRFYSLDNRWQYEAAKQHTDVWLKWFKFLAYEKYKLLIPAFPWARPRRLLPGLDNVEPVIFDPTPLARIDPEIFCGSTDPTALTPTVVVPELRKRTWVLAAMRDIGAWYDKQRFTWPVEQYGNKRLKQPVVTENVLVNTIYGQNWGVIGAPYGAVAAGGGWRARYVHAAAAGCILFLDPEEGRVAGQPYDLFRSVLEAASTDELAEIARRQAEHLWTNTWTLDRLTSNLVEYVS